MKIIPLAADSMGTRSMATFIRTKDLSILIDPAVALGPLRFGLAPHPREERKLEVHLRRIKRYARKADVLVVSHYHYDHHDPDEPELYKNKILLTKHPQKKINSSQKKRAAHFLNQLHEIPKRIEFSDAGEFVFKNTTIRFSNAVPHGFTSGLGYVTQVCVMEGKKKFLHTSDVQGPCLDEQTKFILDENPDVIFCDGPMTYMMGFRYSKQALKESLKNMVQIIEETRLKKFVLDHHLLRDIAWGDTIEDVKISAKKKKVRIMTFAEVADMRINNLEARRKELYKKQTIAPGNAKRPHK